MTTNLNDFSNQPIPAKLWHYTNLGGLEGILSSGVLWATEVRSTTDSSEFVHAREFVTNSVNSLPEEDPHCLRAKSFVLDKLESDFNQGLLSTSYQGIFVVSFSAAEDLMSQWGWYAESGYGVSIAFDLTKARPPHTLRSTVTIAPCIYADADKQKLINEAIRELAETVTRLSRSVGDIAWVAEQMSHLRLVRSTWSVFHTEADLKQDLNDQLRREMIRVVTQYLSDLMKLSGHCKHNAFRQEDEWRVLLPVRKDQLQKLIKYRGGSKQIPYIYSNLFQPNKLPITEVMMGPRCEERDRIAELLAQFEYDVPISTSTIPLRDPEKLSQS